MPDFNATLLREKFVMTDTMPADLNDAAPVIALSNRLVLPLVSANGELSETYVVRAQNMHSCARFAAQLARDFQEGGPLLNRPKPFDWHAAWLAVTKGYEKTWNPGRWVCVYHRGRIVFEEGPGARHVLLDIIEQCDARGLKGVEGSYPKTLEVAQDAFRQAGKLITINYDSNIAMVLGIAGEEAKCGIIVRGPSRTTTFNMLVRKKAGRVSQASQCLTAAAAFLEGIQLAFTIGMTRQKLKYELIAPMTPDAKKADEAGGKLGRLNGAIQQMENLFDIQYRPDRPDFSRLINDAEEFAKRALRGELERRIGEEGEEGWVV